VSKVTAELRRFSGRVAAAKVARRIARDLREARQNERPGTPVRVAVRVTGGIGDHVVAARFLRDLLAAVGPLAIDIYSSKREVSAWIFGSLDAEVTCRDEKILWDRLRPNYAVAFYVTQFACVYAETADWSYLATRAPKLVDVCLKLEAFRPRIEACIQHHPRLDGHLGRIASFMGLDRRTFLQAMAGIPYGGDALSLNVDLGALEKFGLAGRPYVTIHNGFDAEFGKALATSTKVYTQFDDVVARIKTLFPDLCVVQIGTVTSRPIASADINLIGATTLRELAAVVQNARLNIDNESGIVHLASCFDVRSCVVFGPTSVEYYGYPQNINLEPPVCGGCWWLNEDWMSRCAKGHEQAICMVERTPESVFEALVAHAPAWHANNSNEPRPQSPDNDEETDLSGIAVHMRERMFDSAVRVLLGMMPVFAAARQLVA